MNLKSQETRRLAPEMDPLRMGMGWTAQDLEKPQVLIESTYGQSHPGSAHLLQFAQEAAKAADAAGAKSALYFATDMCDGMSQGHDGGNYSLVSRDTIANLIEIHANATTFDAGVFIASCDKSVPAQLMAIGRINIPSIVVTGGVMEAGPDLLTLEQIGKYSAMFQRGEITEEQFTFYKHHACPSCGACSFMGTASTMQIMAEALGLMLPGSALMPATCEDLVEVARKAGARAAQMAVEGITARDMVTEKSFENAVMVHAAISGSTNTLLHLPAIAREFGVELDADSFDRMHRGAHYLLDIRPAGRWPAEYFYYAGGVPRIMEEIKSMLHLDVMTVTGQTLGENLEELKHNGFYERCEELLKKTGLQRTDIIRTFGEPIGTNGTIAVLKGNLAPQGSVVKHSAVPKEMHQAILKARPFDCEEEAIDAILHHRIQPGDAVLIRYEGAQGQRHAGDVLHHRGHLLGPGAFRLHRAAYRRAVLRGQQGAGHWPRLPRGRRGRAHRPGGGGRLDSGGHPRTGAAHLRHPRQGGHRGGNRRGAGPPERALAAPAAQVHHRRLGLIHKKRCLPHEGRLHGLTLRKEGYPYGKCGTGFAGHRRDSRHQTGGRTEGGLPGQGPAGGRHPRGGSDVPHPGGGQVH